LGNRHRVVMGVGGWGEWTYARLGLILVRVPECVWGRGGGVLPAGRGGAVPAQQA
jgi:hypothetical protein